MIIGSSCINTEGCLVNRDNCSEDSLDRLGKILFFFCVLMEKNEFLARLNYLQWPILFMLTTILLIRLSFKNRIINDFIFTWAIAFTLWVLSSLILAINSGKVLEDVKYLIKIIVILGYGIYILKKDQSIKFLVLSMIFSTLISISMILPNIVISGESQILSRAQIIIRGVEVNTNQVCPSIAFAVIFLMYQIKICKKMSYKILYFFMAALFVMTILFLGARGSLLIVLIGIMLSALSGSGKSVIRNVIFAFILIIIMLIMVMNIPFLYEAIGNRIVDTVNLILGNTYVSENQKSDNFRMMLISNGWNMFLKRPLLGYGSGNYASINLVEFDVKYYSHNNYIELLTGLGIVGTIIYYLFHFRLIFLIFVNRTLRHNSYINLAKQIILCMLALDITSVTYNVMDMWLCLIIAYGSIYLGNTVKDKRVRQ